MKKMKHILLPLLVAALILSLFPVSSLAASAKTARPKGTEITSVKAAVTRLTVKWKKPASKISGYQIQYGKAAAFKSKNKKVLVKGKSSTEYLLNGLKPDTTYCVRIRTYKTVKNKMYFSAWSRLKRAKTAADENNPYRKYAKPDEAVLAMAKNNAEIGLQILRERLAAEGAINSMVSPVSLYEDLAMLTNAASGETLAELEKYLGGSITELNEGIAGYNGALPGSVHIANSIWLNHIYGPIAPGFSKTARDSYKAKIASKPFDDDTVKLINAWVKKNTKNMIPSIIDRLSPEDVMILLNAVAFESEWKGIYSKENIKEKSTFTNAAGEKENCVMLHSEEAELLTLNDNEGTIAKGFLRPYGDGKTAFLGLLPAQGKTPQDVLNSLNGETYMAMYRGRALYQGGTIYAGIPEFKLDDEIELDKFMKKAGVQKTFTQDAEFSGMLESEKPVYVDSVLQKTHIEVDRAGTKAAAVTAIMAKATAMPSQQNEHLILDRPFLYMIVDYQSGLPLFMGVQNSIK